MYARFGYIRCARYLFEEMPERNEASWNTMVSGFVRLGLYHEAVCFFCEMGGYGVKASGFVIASLVTACDRSGCLFREGTQLHGFAVKYGLFSDVFVGTSLLHFYGAYRLVDSARKLFEEMPDKNVVSWTSLMAGYSDIGEPMEVMSIYKRMRCEDIDCNENTLATVISACGLLEDGLLGHQIMAHVLKFGLETNVSVGNSLVNMFGCLGSVEKAGYIFAHMGERDTISWNSMISANAHNGFYEESLRCYHLMRCVHGEVNSTTLSTLLSVCGSVDNLKWGRGFHGIVLKMGLSSDVCICNTLVSMYSEAGRSEDAELVFQGMQERDLISWNSMMVSYVQDAKSLDALEILAEMISTGKEVNYITFTCALAACSNPKFLIEGKILHALTVVSGLFEWPIVGNALVTMYAKAGMMTEAERVLQTMSRHEVVTWNALIGGHVENGQTDEAMKAFQLMRKEGISADYITITSVLGACVTPNDLRKYGTPIHAHIVLTGFESDKYVQNSLITMYGKCADLASSKYIFDRLAHKNSISWNACLAGNSNHGHGEEVLKLIVTMRSDGVELDQFSFSEGLAATAKLAMLEEGQQLHGLAVKLGFEADSFVANAAMDMYGKCGEMDDVLRILSPPVNRSRLSWNILISAFARHGYFQEARETFDEMLKMGITPDHVTFVSLLSACNHGGLVDEGLAYYFSMSKDFGILPGIEHCVCIIDLLGRSGRLDQAETFIAQMPVPPNDLIWRSLLAASKLHGNLDLGRKAAERLLELDPSDDSAYVLYSNVCATTGRWEDVENVRKQMGSNNIKKQPACSWVKLKNRVSSFGIGDRTHPETKEIYTKLGELKKMIKEAGYVPDTSYALQDTDEEQKEHNLWNHSERLALAFGLINTPQGTTIRIFKNLRVCCDCHSVYKFVSEITRRKIILRDPYRFHHFSRGKCSCCDYW